MPISENIKKMREIFGVTQDELGEIAGVTGNAVSQWENGRAEPRMGAIERMAACFQLSKSHIIEDGGMDMVDPVTKRPRGVPNLPANAVPVYSSGEATVPLRVLGKVHAGELAYEEEVDRRIDVPASVLAGHRRSFAVLVEGNCMDKKILPGEHAIVDPDMVPQNGSIVIAEVEGYQAIMRRWYKGNRKLMLSADSHEDYDDLIFGEGDGPVTVLGVVFWHQASEEMR